MNYVAIGCITIDNILNAYGEKRLRQFGGNAAYGAMGMRLWQEYQGGDERTTDLLQALRPFLRKERQARLDRAVQLAKLSHVIRVALQVLGEKGEDRHV